MTRTTVSLLVLGLVAACGKTTTLGVPNHRDTPDRDGGIDSDSGTGAAGGLTVTADGAVANAGAGGASTVTADGAVASAGGAVANAGSGSAVANSGGFGGTGGDPAPVVDPCKLPAPTPSGAAETERDDLIRAYCAALAEGSCVTQGVVGHRIGNLEWDTRIDACDSPEDSLRVCILDMHFDYSMHIKTPDCETPWRSAARCLAAVDYRAAGCNPPLAIAESAFGTPRPCDAEKAAVAECVKDIGGGVKGSRGACSFGPDPSSSSGCGVLCDNNDGNLFEASCTGAAGLPLNCNCTLNGHTLWDDAEHMAARFLATDCRAAAVAMAAGTCLERVDCCFSWAGTEASPRQHCSCTSDPTKLGQATCQDAATALHGQVVGLCPQYGQNPGCIPTADNPCP